MGWPVAEWAAETSSQLEAWWWAPNERSSWAPMERSEVAAAGALAALEELDPPEGEGNCTEPGSGRARPGLANADVVS